MEEIKARIVFDTSGLSKGIPTGGSGAGGIGTSGVAGALGKVGGSGVGGVMGMISGIFAAVAGILGAVMLIVSASRPLQKILGGIFKVLMLILKPIGDIFAVALMPLLFLLKPLALFFNMLMKPYIKQAMMSMKAGSTLLAAGDGAGAAGAFLTGIAWLLKPFSDMMTEMMRLLGEALIELLFAPITLLLEGFKLLGNAFFDIIEALSPIKGITDNARASFNGMMDGLLIKVEDTKKLAKEQWSLLLDVAKDKMTEFLTKATNAFVATAEAAKDSAESAAKSAREAASSASRSKASNGGAGSDFSEKILKNSSGAWIYATSHV